MTTARSIILGSAIIAGAILVVGLYWVQQQGSTSGPERAEPFQAESIRAEIDNGKASVEIEWLPTNVVKELHGGVEERMFVVTWKVSNNTKDEWLLIDSVSLTLMAEPGIQLENMKLDVDTAYDSEVWKYPVYEPPEPQPNASAVEKFFASNKFDSSRSIFEHEGWIQPGWASDMYNRKIYISKELMPQVSEYRVSTKHEFSAEVPGNLEKL